MATPRKKTASRTVSKKLPIPIDLSEWNFVIFLTLAFILLVIVAVNMKNVAFDLRTKAFNNCPQIPELPRPEACPGGKWTYQRDANGCQAFFCQPNP